MNHLLTEAAGSVARRLGTFAAGALVAVGVTDASAISAVEGGVVALLLVGFDLALAHWSGKRGKV